MGKALAWPAIKAEDVKALQACAIFLCGCCNVMEAGVHAGVGYANQHETGGF